MDDSYNKSLELLDSTLRLVSKQTNSDENRIRLLNSFGFTLRFVGEFSEAIRLLGESLSLCKIAYDGPHGNQAQAYEYLAICYRDINEFDSVRFHITQAEKIYLEVFHETDKRLGLFLNNAAVMVGALGDQDQALDDFRQVFPSKYSITMQ